MFIPASAGLALLLMILCACCWGSWANTYKLTRGVRFELFYWDYAIGIFVMAVILAFTLGSSQGGPDAFLANLEAAGGRRILLAMLGGAVFNIANILLVAAIAMAGLAVAFPVSIGTALVLGTILTYLVQRSGNPLLLFLGVAMALAAIVADALAYKEVGSGKLLVEKKSLVVCIVSGLLMGSWSPFTAASMADGAGQLTPYTSIVFFTLGAFASTFLFNTYFMKKPLVGEPVTFRGYFEGGVSWHLLGLVGGFIWSLGTAFNLIAGRAVGFAAAYAIGQSSPMVAALWGIFVWKEFAAASPKAKRYLALMFLFYIGAIGVIANAF
jgi:glucose uptake protein